jgi:hypothetical protein
MTTDRTTDPVTDRPTNRPAGRANDFRESAEMTRVAMFDLDGTLVDSPRAIVETFAAAFEAMGVAPRAAEDVRATIGLPLEQAFATLLGVARDDARVTEGVARYQEAFRTVILPRARSLVFPGVEEGWRSCGGGDSSWPWSPASSTPAPRPCWTRPACSTGSRS